MLIFKKIISAICSAALVASFAIVPVIAEENQVSWNFEADIAAGFTDLGRSSTSIVDGSTADTGNSTNYVEMHNVGSSRATAQRTFDEVSATNLRVSYDAYFTTNSTGMKCVAVGNSVIKRMSTENVLQTENVVFAVGNNGSGSITINTTTSTGIAAGSWISVKGIVNFDSKTVDVTISDYETQEVLYTGTVDFYDTSVTELGSVVLNSSRGVTDEAIYFDNFKIDKVDIPAITVVSDKILPASSATVATVSSADGTPEVSVDNDAASVAMSGSDVVLTVGDGISVGDVVTVTVKAEKDEVTTKSIKVTVGTEQDFADAGAAAVDIVGSNTKITKDTETGTYIVMGNFDVPVESEGAKVTWESSDTSLVSISDGTVAVHPSAAGTVTLTATTTYGSASAKTEFVLDLSEFNALANDIVNAALEDEYIYYAADKTGVVVKTALEDEGIIFSDLYLTSSKSVTVNDVEYTAAIDWDIDANSYITADGVISVSDKDKHETTITKTVSYKHRTDGTVIVSDTKSYKMYVQFDPEYVETTVKAAVDAVNNGTSDTAEATAAPDATEAPAAVTATATPVATEASEQVSEDTYLRGFLYDYQVRFDEVYDENFDGIPSSVSSAKTFDLPYECYFGSTLDWESSATSVIKVSNSSHEATVTLPSSSRTVTLTANIIAGSATPATHTESVKVSAKSSKSSSGGTSSGGSTRSSSGGSSGGSISSSVVTPITPSTNSSTTLNPNPSGFTDLDSVSWALTAINNLYVNGVINGKTSTTFAPNDPVTRAEFAKMLVLAFNLATVDADSATFSDVSTSNWASPYVEAAYTNGIITGYEDGSFMPDKNVTRQEMAVMVMRAATAEGRTFEAKTDAVTFTDDSVIASYAKDSISTLQQANVISGVGDGSFDPLASSTRAQACQMIYNVFNK